MSTVMLDYCHLAGKKTDHAINAACCELSNQLGRIEQIEAQEQLTSVERRVMELEATESIISKFLTRCSNPETDLVLGANDQLTFPFI